MAIIEGQSESLKKLRVILHQNGITRFNSIGEINEFTKRYESIKNGIPRAVETELAREMHELQSTITRGQQSHNTLKSNLLRQTSTKIKKLEKIIELSLEKRKKTIILKIFYYLKAKLLDRKKVKINKNFIKTLRKKTLAADKIITTAKDNLSNIIKNKEVIISKRQLKLSNEHHRIKKIVDELYTLIAGAIGENLVSKEIEKLTNDYYLFNDFSIEFDPPIYNKKKNDRIFSMQIDHLLISRAGIFIIETKNWSKQSVKSFDLRSPVKQILRSNYALFVLLNSQARYSSIKLEKHHWGDKQIPIRNLIVMVSNNPQEKFNHVKVLSVKELNKYITYFDYIFSNKEVKNIYDYFMSCKSTQIQPLKFNKKSSFFAY